MAFEQSRNRNNQSFRVKENGEEAAIREKELMVVLSLIRHTSSS